MPRSINRLTDKTVKALTEPGMHADGAGLYLKIDQTENRRWVLVYFWRKKRREMGLGSAAAVSLKAARLAADEAREKLRAGEDPIAARKVETGSVTFGALAERVVKDLEPGWKNEKAGEQWRASLNIHAKALSKMPVADVQTADVLAVLTPIWQRIPETASRVRARIERVLDVAKVEGLRTGENPARWKGHLALLLARQARKDRHWAALPYEQVPAFIEELRVRRATAAEALEFAILTACRTMEVLGATWEEIDGDVWTIPAERTKTSTAHRVPLTPQMWVVLERVRPLRTKGDFIFPGDQRIEPMSNASMLMLLERMKKDFTVHGFRSSFRDWAGDCTTHPREVIEAALGHAVGSAVERAYRRRDALEKRRLLMEAWSTYCTTPSNVVRFPDQNRA